jgi:hypothetical protein
MSRSVPICFVSGNPGFEIASVNIEGAAVKEEP